MANATTFQNNVVMAGKFVTVGTGVSVAKQSIKAIASAIAIEDNSHTINRVKEMQDSDGFSVSEKKELKLLSESIQQKYQTLYSLVDSVNYTGSDWDTLNEKYYELLNEFGRVLYDMSRDFTEETNLSTLVQQYLDYAQTFSVSINQYVNDSDGYSIQLSVSPSHPLEAGEALEVTLSVFSPDGLQYALSENEKSTVQWYFGDTSDDSAYETAHRGENPLRITNWDSMFTGRSIEISASLTIYPS